MNNIQPHYVISLTSAYERRKHIQKEFAKQQIPFVFFDAITPDKIQQKSQVLGINIENSPLTAGEIACALSHIALWQMAQSQNLPYICIFEDDIYLGENANKILNINYLPKTVDVLKLETYPFDQINRFCPTKISRDGRKFFRLRNKHVGMAGYVVTAKGCDFLLTQLRNQILVKPIDDFIFRQFLTLPEYQVWQVSPALCIQDFMLYRNTHFQSALDAERAIRCQHMIKPKKVWWKKLIHECCRPFMQIKMKCCYASIKFR